MITIKIVIKMLIIITILLPRVRAIISAISIGMKVVTITLKSYNINCNSYIYSNINVDHNKDENSIGNFHYYQK